MNKDIVVGLYKGFAGKLKKSWGILKDDKIKRAAGTLKIVEGFLQSRFGFIRFKTKQKAQEVVKDLKSEVAAQEADSKPKI